jgi:hypothetical protein
MTRIGVLCIGLVIFYPLSRFLPARLYDTYDSHELQGADLTSVCPQVEPLLPSSDTNRKLAEELEVVLSDPSFEAIAAEYLGGAVRIP